MPALALQAFRRAIEHGPTRARRRVRETIRTWVHLDAILADLGVAGDHG
jgi:hypothetical protein